MANPSIHPAKATRWQFTAYEDQFHIIDAIERAINNSEEWDMIDFRTLKYQTEICPDTGRTHRQGALQSSKQIRFTTMKRLLQGVHVEPARNWHALLKYCEKTETRLTTGKRVDTSTESRPIRIDELMVEFGCIWWEEQTCPSCKYIYGYGGHYHMHAFHLEMCVPHKTYKPPGNPNYWEIANTFIDRFPHLAGLVAQPMPQNLWKHTRQTWLSKALISITQRPGADDQSAEVEINEVVHDLISVPQISDAPRPPSLPSPANCEEEGFGTSSRASSCSEQSEG